MATESVNRESPLGFGVDEYTPTGLAFHEGKLYMVGQDTNKLYTLDTSTGIANEVGNLSERTLLNPTDLTSHKGVLYMIGETEESLYTIDTSNGKASHPRDMATFGIPEKFAKGIASYNDSLFILCTGAGSSSAPIPSLGTLPQVSVHKYALYALRDSIDTEPSYDSNHPLDIYADLSGLYSTTDSLCMIVRSGGKFYEWNQEGGGTIEVATTSRIDGMKADYWDGLFCVVGLSDYTRLNRVGWSSEEILREIDHRKDMLLGLDSNIFHLTDNIIREIVDFIGTRINYNKLLSKDITRLRFSHILLDNAIQQHRSENRLPNDGGPLFVVRHTLLELLTHLAEIANR